MLAVHLYKSDLPPGYRRSYPINLLFAEACEPVLQVRIRLLADKSNLKLISLEEHPLQEKLCAYLVQSREQNKLKENREKFLLLDSFINQFYSKRTKIKLTNQPLPYPYNYETTIEPCTSEIDYSNGPKFTDPVESNVRFNEFITELQEKEFIIFYTDGSKIKDSYNNGLAIYSPELEIEEQFKINKTASIFTTEALAITVTMNIITKLNISKAAICTDSLSVLMAALQYSPAKTKNTNYLILEIKNKMKEAKERNIIIKLIWIPSHKGIVGNEKADLLAKSACTKGRSLQIRLPFSDFMEEIKLTNFKRSEKILKERGKMKGKNYFTKYYKSTKKPWFYQSTYPRYHIVTINRLRANHYNLSESLCRKRIVPSPRCECGCPKEDIEHVIVNCPRFNHERQTLIKRFKNKNKESEIKINIEEILKQPNGTKAKFITDFLM